MDLVGLVTVGNFVAKLLDLRSVGDIDDMRRDAQPLRQSRLLVQPLRFRQAVGETSHIATLQASAANWRTSSRPANRSKVLQVINARHRHHVTGASRLSRRRSSRRSGRAPVAFSR
jgi:hypothetical protein